MNHVLLFDEDFIDSQHVQLVGPRHQHITSQLKANVDDSIRVGHYGGLLGRAEITALNSTSLTLRPTLNETPPAAAKTKLVLAMPRPKVFRRVLRSAIELGVKEIFLINSWRVEKSYWQTPMLSELQLQETIIQGLSIAKDTVPPTIHIEKRFKPFVEDELSTRIDGAPAYVAHPSSSPLPSTQQDSHWLAIGPEGGFIPYEVDLLTAYGFSPVSLGERILRVENAVSAALAKLNI